MKNVHVLPTEKPSRLYSWEELRIGDSVIRPTHLGMFNQYIYITDDSEIKVGDWCLVLSSKKEYLIEKYSFHSDCIIAKKIILTTDPDLIAYGVQSIDDEFLEWFVKNQSCESVQVEKVEGRYVDYRGNVHTPISYEIIIPKEAPKQENCCTPTGQIKRYKDCIGCDRKPKQENTETFKQNRMEQNIERCYEPSEKQVCCYLDCNEKAEFHLQELGMGTTYEDYTELCAKHLDEMIPFGSSFEVWRLDN